MTPRTRCAPSPRSSGERVAQALSAFTRVCDALWRGPGEGQRARKSRLSSVAPHPARAFSARHPLPANCGERVEIEFAARAESISHERARGRCVRCFTLRPADAFYRGGVTERSVMAVGRSPPAAPLGRSSLDLAPLALAGGAFFIARGLDRGPSLIPTAGVLDSSCPGLTRASIEKEALHSRRWIAGSSPAMTAVSVYGGWY